MTVHFIGAGPGAPDLLTLRAARLIESCQACLYAGSLVPQQVVQMAPNQDHVHDTASMTLDEIIDLMKDFHEKGMDISRVHSGDPSLYGAIAEQMSRLDDFGIDYDVTPGVPAYAAAAAAMKKELTLVGVSQSVILTRTSMRSSKMPAGEELAQFAQSGATLMIHLSINQLVHIIKELIPFYGPSCPVVVAYRVGWPDELFIHGRLDNIRERVKKHRITRTALIMVGKVLDVTCCDDSSLYSPSHTHILRPK